MEDKMKRIYNRKMPILDASRKSLDKQAEIRKSQTKLMAQSVMAQDKKKMDQLSKLQPIRKS